MEKGTLADRPEYLDLQTGKTGLLYLSRAPHYLRSSITRPISSPLSPILPIVLSAAPLLPLFPATANSASTFHHCMGTAMHWIVLQRLHAPFSQLQQHWLSFVHCRTLAHTETGSLLLYSCQQACSRLFRYCTTLHPTLTHTQLWARNMTSIVTSIPLVETGRPPSALFHPVHKSLCLFDCCLHFLVC